MEIKQEQKKGEISLFLQAILWSFFPIITILSYAAIPSMYSLLWSTLFASVFFAAVITYKGKWRELKNLLLWKYSFFIALSLGVLYYGFFFLGLRETTAGNAAIISQFAVFTIFFFFNVIHGEHASPEYKVGGALMVLGALIVLGKDFTHFNMGDFFILIATFCSPVGNLYQQKARTFASSESIMLLRSILSLPFIFAAAYFLHGSLAPAAIYSSLPFLLINGILLLGISKILYIEAIHRIPVPKAIALNSITPLLTLLFAWPLLGQTPNIWQIISLVPIFFGVLLLTDNMKFKNNIS